MSTVVTKPIALTKAAIDLVWWDLSGTNTRSFSLISLLSATLLRIDSLICCVFTSCRSWLSCLEILGTNLHEDSLLYSGFLIAKLGQSLSQGWHYSLRVSIGSLNGLSRRNLGDHLRSLLTRPFCQSHKVCPLRLQTLTSARMHVHAYLNSAVKHYYIPITIN